MILHISVITLPVEDPLSLSNCSKESCWLSVELRRLSSDVLLLWRPISLHKGLNGEHTLIKEVCHLFASDSPIKTLLVHFNLLVYLFLLLQVAELLYNNCLSSYLMLLEELANELLTDVKLRELPMKNHSSLCQSHALLAHNCIRRDNVINHLLCNLPSPLIGWCIPLT